MRYILKYLGCSMIFGFVLFWGTANAMAHDDTLEGSKSYSTNYDICLCHDGKSDNIILDCMDTCDRGRECCCNHSLYISFVNICRLDIYSDTIVVQSDYNTYIKNIDILNIAHIWSPPD